MWIISQTARHSLPRRELRWLSLFCLLASMSVVAEGAAKQTDVEAPGKVIEKLASRRSRSPTVPFYKENILNGLPDGFRKWHPNMHPSGICDRTSHRVFMSGSAQFSKNGLKLLISKIGHSGKIYIIDLRAEPHGYVNGHEICFKDPPRNSGRRLFSPSAVDVRERSYLRRLLGGSVKEVATERQLVERLGLSYVRIPVEDYRYPTDSQVDRFVSIVGKLQQRSWLHFHCKAGKGRTTLFMTMYDMMHHAKRVSFDAFIVRHRKLFGTVHFQKGNSNNNRRGRWGNERQRFLERFYWYCSSDHRGFKKPWSKYKQHMSHRWPCGRYQCKKKYFVHNCLR